MLRFPLPTVAGINGAALAGGFDLATLCDLRLASSAARFAHPEQRFGDVMYAPLRELIGGAAARDLSEELTSAAAAIAQAPRRNLLRMKAKIIAGTAIPAASPTLDI